LPDAFRLLVLAFTTRSFGCITPRGLVRMFVRCCRAGCCRLLFAVATLFVVMVSPSRLVRLRYARLHIYRSLRLPSVAPAFCRLFAFAEHTVTAGFTVCVQFTGFATLTIFCLHFLYVADTSGGWLICVCLVTHCLVLLPSTFTVSFLPCRGRFTLVHYTPRYVTHGYA